MPALLCMAAVGAISGARPAQADARPAALFGNHMVLQRGALLPVWGTAAEGERVTVRIGAQQARTTAHEGRWRVTLKPLPAGGPYTLSIQARNRILIQDVLIGEVWLASGQSNMDFTVARTQKKYFAGTRDADREISTADYPRIRMFTVELKMADTPQPDVVGHWSVCSPDTVGDFSAVAYFFGRELHQTRQVPVGLITSTWGASTAQAWTSRAALLAQPELKPLVDDYDGLIRDGAEAAAAARYAAERKAWEEAAAKAKAAGARPPRAPRPPRNPHEDQHNPCLLYNGMIAPLVPYAIRGAIWYQGESNGPTAERYLLLMKTLIGDWRRAWGEGEFPFLFVQLANYRSPTTLPVEPRSTIAFIREGQLRTLEVPNTGMAVAIDIGDSADIHPRNKQEVGHRLALAARALVYGEKIAFSGPLYTGMQVEGSAVRLRFKHVNGGLEAHGGDRLTGFAIAGADGRFVWSDARIEGETVVVSSPSVLHPAAVRYGWADNPPANLYNRAGLPASPFRTDISAKQDSGNALSEKTLTASGSPSQSQ